MFIVGRSCTCVGVPGPTKMKMNTTLTQTAPKAAAPAALFNGVFNGVFEFSLSGKLGGVYRIQTTTDLTSGNWTDLGLLTNSASSTRFSDPNAAQAISSFYRAVLEP